MKWIGRGSVAEGLLFCFRWISLFVSCDGRFCVWLGCAEFRRLITEDWSASLISVASCWVVPMVAVLVSRSSLVFGDRIGQCDSAMGVLLEERRKAFQDRLNEVCPWKEKLVWGVLVDRISWIFVFAHFLCVLQLLIRSVFCKTSLILGWCYDRLKWSYSSFVSDFDARADG